MSQIPQESIDSVSIGTIRPTHLVLNFAFGLVVTGLALGAIDYQLKDGVGKFNARAAAFAAANPTDTHKVKSAPKFGLDS